MHIAFWCPGWPLAKFQNGIVTYVHVMRMEFERQGHRVSVFTSVLDKSCTDERVHEVRRPMWERVARRYLRRWLPVEQEILGFSSVIARRILKVHRQEPIDILEIEESFGWFADIQRVSNLPMVVRLHGPAFLSLVDDELKTFFGQERERLEGIKLRHACAISSPCKSTLDETLRRYQSTPKLTRHIVNPVAIPQGPPQWQLIECEKNTILFVGRFDLRKGGDLILRAFAMLLSRVPDAKLIFVGPDIGLLLPDGRRQHLREFCESEFPQNIRDRIDYRGALANREITTLRLQAMVTVVASRWENPGYALLEAMLQGCPIVSSDAGGCPETITHEVTGRLAKSGDAVDLARQLEIILADPNAASALGRAAYLHMRDTYASDRIAKQSLEFYEQAIENYRQP